MEVQLIQLSRISPGLVSSSIISSSSGRRIEPGESSLSNDVFPSICSTGRLMAFVSSYKAEFLACDDAISLNKSNLSNYVTSYEGLLHVVRDPMLPKPTATACLVVPFTIELKSGVSQTSSVVIVGFTDGFIRGYSKTGKSVFSQLLHPEPVASLRVLCPSPYYDQTSEKSLSSLVVLLKGKVVCLINGASLTDEIKHNISKWNKDKFDNYSDSSDEEQREPLSYKKFLLQDQSSISDVALSGQSTVSGFDYLREASIIGGWDMTIRSGPTAEVKLITVGEQPMVALYRISKDAGTLNMSEVVHAVASRMTSAVLGKLSWLNSWGGAGGGAKSSTSQTPTKGKTHEEKQQPKMNLPMNTNIPDPRRHVKSIVLSPVGNIAVIVDGFGRVMLLDVNSFVIRRMWKGYRDAQCGWLVVSDPTDSNRQAQCLCIYAARRGILEFWPVQNGPRVAAFQVGKGCSLLHITRCLFRSEQTGRDTSSITEFGDRAILICSDGRLLTFTVPFTSLIQCNTPKSHDSRMLQTLEQAIASGNETLIIEVAESVKSYQVLKKILQYVIDAYGSCSEHGITDETIIKVLNIAVNKTTSLKDFTVPEELHRNCVIMRQLVQFYFNITKLHESPTGQGVVTDGTDTANSLSQFFQDSCEVSFQFAERTEALLCSYFQSCESHKSVRHATTLSDVLNCFKLYDASIDCLLSSFKQSEVNGTPPQGAGSVKEEPVLLKDGLSDIQLVDLGEFIFKNLLSTSSSSSFGIDTLFKESGIDPGQLLGLLIRYWTNNGFVYPSSITLCARSLYDITRSLLLQIPIGNSEHWNNIQQIIVNSHSPGYALLVTIVCSYLSMDKSSSKIKIDKKCKETNDSMEESEDDEMWETVTIDREEWARLNELLELLTELSIVIGVQTLKQLPAVLFIKSDDHETILDIEKLKIKMLFGESSNKDGVCVSSLKETGPVLIGHCISKSMVSRSIPAELIMDKGSQTFSQNMRTIMNTLQGSLCISNLLVYCGFHAALDWSETDSQTEDRKSLLLLVADYVTMIPSHIKAQGMCGFLWHFLFEKEITGIVKDKKVGTLIQDDSYSMFLWMCRSIISFLIKANDCQEGNEGVIDDNERKESKRDIITIGSPPKMMFLPTIVDNFPKYDSESLRLCLQLILVLEILQYSPVQAINVFSFFPPSFSSKWMKGIYHIGTGTDVVHKNLQNKRTEFLNKSVSAIINGSKQQAIIKPTATFSCLKSLTCPATATQLYEFSDYTDIVFGLASLWSLKTSDDIRTYWIANLFAADLDTNGKQVFLAITDKNTASIRLLSLAGHFVYCLVVDKDKQTQSMLFSHCSPGILEWMRKQQQASQQLLTSSKITTTTHKTIITSLLSMIKPHLQVSTPSHNEQIFGNIESLLKLL